MTDNYPLERTTVIRLTNFDLKRMSKEELSNYGVVASSFGLDGQIAPEGSLYDCKVTAQAYLERTGVGREELTCEHFLYVTKKADLLPPASSRVQMVESDSTSYYIRDILDMMHLHESFLFATAVLVIAGIVLATRGN
jgi:hypothetical protein